ncbi:MAG: Na+/H+ antiporter NhaC [Myxococcales bacterium]
MSDLGKPGPEGMDPEGDAELDSGKPARPIREPSLFDSLFPMFLLVIMIGGGILLFGLDALDGPVQAALVVCSLVTGVVIMKNGHPWEKVEASGQRALSSITSAVFILLAVGALIGSWCLAGTIPTMVYYGLQLLSPAWYYPACAMICGIIAMSIGSSWTTAGTIGVGLVGIATMLGVSPAITAGAVISGAYLGDKLSPLSETTILTAQMVKVDVYEHIKRQAWTSVPAFVLALLGFFLLARFSAPTEKALDTGIELKSLDQIYNLSLINLLPLILLAVMSIRKIPAALSLMTAALFAGLMAPFTQPEVVRNFVGEAEYGSVHTALAAIWQSMATGFEIKSGYADIDRLLTRGGMDSMMLTLWLIIGAVTFGTLLEDFGMIKRLVDPMVRSAKSTGRLYFTVFANAFGLNIIAGDQYIALVLPARVFRLEFEKRGLAATNLSRLAADSGTVTSPLVPWNSCGAFMAAVLGVPTLAYLPFAFFNIFSPALSVLYGVTGFKIRENGAASAAAQVRGSVRMTIASPHHGATTTEAQAPRSPQKLSIFSMTAMVVGSMVGAGVFSLPRNFAQATGVFGALIAWTIAGFGMLMLAFVFQSLAVRRPDLDAGIYAYAKEGFGHYLGFMSAFGFWASACVGNVTYWVLIKSTLGAVLPKFGEGNTLIAVAISSVGIWAFHIMILRGVKEAAGINQVVTAAKIIPILAFIALVAFAVQRGQFSANLWGGGERSVGALYGQIKATMLATVFVFIGVEGASVYSRYAKRREDVGRATVLGFVGVLALFASVTLLSYGVLSREALGELRQPSMGGVLEAVVGRWGAGFIGTGLIVSVLGAYLAWTLMATEVAYMAAKNEDMPRAFSRTNRRGVPSTALLATSGLTQVFLLITLFSDDAFNFTLELTSALSLVPYLLAAAFALKLALASRKERKLGRTTERTGLLIAALATLYTAFLLYAAGPKYLLVSCLIYGPGTVLFWRSRTEHGHKVFSAKEGALFAVLASGAVFALIALSKGWVSI